MAYKGKTIFNSNTKIETKFLQTSKDTGGQLLEMETTYPARSPKPPLHYHPQQEEHFVILSGEMTANVDGEVRILKQGDTLHIPKNAVHAMWNHTKEPAVVNWKVRPALDTEYLFETATGLANDGKTSKGGAPTLLQSALLITRFSREFRLTKPKLWAQRIVFGLLSPFAWLAGYRSTYAKYLD